eukprot:2052927-Pyramimonas_sp.AAC.1
MARNQNPRANVATESCRLLAIVGSSLFASSICLPLVLLLMWLVVALVAGVDVCVLLLVPLSMVPLFCWLRS